MDRLDLSMYSLPPWRPGTRLSDLNGSCVSLNYPLFRATLWLVFGSISISQKRHSHRARNKSSKSSDVRRGCAASSRAAVVRVPPSRDSKRICPKQGADPPVCRFLVLLAPTTSKRWKKSCSFCRSGCGSGAHEKSEVLSDSSSECFCVQNDKHGGTPNPQANRVSGRFPWGILHCHI